MRRTAPLLILLALTASAELASSDDWNQWRGPRRDGRARASEGPSEWRGLELTTVWKRPVGVGYAAPSVAKGRVFSLGASAGKETLRAFRATDGDPLWSFSYAAKSFDRMNVGGPAASPCIIAGRVFTLSRDGQAHCLDAASGQLLWRRDFVQQHGAKPPSFGVAGSLVIEAGRVYLEIGRVFCLDADTGAVIWQSGDEGSGYSTPVLFDHGGARQLAAFPDAALIILDPATGVERARFPWTHKPNVHAATPLVFAGGTRIFISTGYNKGCALLAFDGAALKAVWKNRNMRTEMATCALQGELIIGFDNATLRALDAQDGKILWSARGYGKGSLIVVGDTLLVLTDKGEIVAGSATRSGFTPLMRRAMLDGQGCWTAPVVSDGRLYLRDPGGQLLSARLRDRDAPAPRVPGPVHPVRGARGGLALLPLLHVLAAGLAAVHGAHADPAGTGPEKESFKGACSIDF